ncbi:MAG TPA: iron-sulfur cluster assembly scaffold protein, partial [Candidatus Acidoferrales bacterium]|nr:iron-sulfur cluster assembly scaffold protein [Candidatus Acidoferrales bacterium]
MAYSDKVIDHYNHPRNVGSLPKDDPNVGTGLVDTDIVRELSLPPVKIHCS